MIVLELKRMANSWPKLHKTPILKSQKLTKTLFYYNKYGDVKAQNLCKKPFITYKQRE